MLHYVHEWIVILVLSAWISETKTNKKSFIRIRFDLDYDQKKTILFPHLHIIYRALVFFFDQNICLPISTLRARFLYSIYCYIFKSHLFI